MQTKNLLLFSLLLGSSFAVLAADEIINPLAPKGTVLDTGAAPAPTVSGISFGGISLNDSSFYEIPTEKCPKGDVVAELVGEYGLTEKVYIFQSERGYGVVEMSQIYRDLETGVRRKSNNSCRVFKGMKIQGELDCKGIKTVKKEPYENCAFEAKIWGHSQSELGAFALVTSKLDKQFREYASKCQPVSQGKSLKERMDFGF